MYLVQFAGNDGVNVVLMFVKDYVFVALLRKNV